jgi:hypothetical protein
MFFPTLLNEINISPQALRLYIELIFDPTRDLDMLAADCYKCDTDQPGPTLTGAINELHARRMLMNQNHTPLPPSFWHAIMPHKAQNHPLQPQFFELQAQPKHLFMPTTTFRLLVWLLCQPNREHATLPTPESVNLAPTQFAQAADDLRARDLLPKPDDEIGPVEE